jgi:hypothetical protein
VGLGGLLVAGLGGWRDRVATRDLADRERRQNRLADAYVDLLDLCLRVGYWASQLRPITAPPDYQPPEPPTTDEQTRVRAKLAAYGSRAVQDLHEAWHSSVQAIVKADLQVALRLGADDRHNRYSPKPGDDVLWRDPTEPWAKIYDEYLPAEKAAREALIATVADELAGRDGKKTRIVGRTRRAPG